MQQTEMTRSSKQRTAILEVLQQTDTHPTADWVYQQVSQRIPNISLGTVYRNLSRLATAGVIQRMAIGDGNDHFDYTVTPHDHFYCEKCGRLYDLPLPYDSTLDRQAAASSCGEIRWHRLVFHGVCQRCCTNNEK